MDPTTTVCFYLTAIATLLFALQHGSNAGIYVTGAIAFALNSAAAATFAWGVFDSRRCLPPAQGASLQPFVKLGLFWALLDASLEASLQLGRARAGLYMMIVALQLSRGSREPVADRVRLIVCFLAVGFARHAAGDHLCEVLMAQGETDESAKLARTMLMVPFALPLHWWWFNRPAPGRTPTAQVQRTFLTKLKEFAAQFQWFLLFMVVGVLLADEMADSAKRVTINRNRLDKQTYMAARAVSLLLGFVGEYVGSKCSPARMATLNGVVQCGRIGSLLLGDGSAAMIVRVGIVFVEDVTGGAVAGSVNTMQEARYHATRGGTKWIDWCETIGKALAPTLVANVARMASPVAVSVVGTALQLCLASVF